MSAFAAPSNAAPPDDGWHLQTSGGIWAMSIDGTVGVRDVESDVDVSFSDLFDKTSFSLNPGVVAQRRLSRGELGLRPG